MSQIHLLGDETPALLGAVELAGPVYHRPEGQEHAAGLAHGVLAAPALEKESGGVERRRPCIQHHSHTVWLAYYTSDM